MLKSTSDKQGYGLNAYALIQSSEIAHLFLLSLRSATGVQQAQQDGGNWQRVVSVLGTINAF